MIYDDLVQEYFKNKHFKLINIHWFIDKSFQAFGYLNSKDYIIGFGHIVDNKISNFRYQIFKNNL
jgi:hypothetical protein